MLDRIKRPKGPWFAHAWVNLLATWWWCGFVLNKLKVCLYFTLVRYFPVYNIQLFSPQEQVQNVFKRVSVSYFVNLLNAELFFLKSLT